MSKAKTAPETETATETRAANGSSVSAQCKQLVRAIAAEIKDQGGIMSDTLEWLNTVASQITATRERGLTPVERLEKFQAERNAIFQAAEVIDGKAHFTDEQETAIEELSAKIARVKREIKKGAESETAE